MFVKSQDRIPIEVRRRLQPLVESVLTFLDLCILDIAVASISDSLRSKIQSEAEAAHGAIAALHAELTKTV